MHMSPMVEGEVERAKRKRATVIVTRLEDLQLMPMHEYVSLNVCHQSTSLFCIWVTKKLFPSVYPFVTLYYSGEIFVKIYVENCVPSSAFSITDTNLLLCTINNPKCWIKIKSAVCPPETYPPKVHPPISNNIQSQLRWGPKAQIKTLRTPQNVPARPGWWLLWGIWGFWWRWRFFTASSQLREFSFLSAVCRRHPLHKDLIDIENIFF